MVLKVGHPWTHPGCGAAKLVQVVPHLHVCYAPHHLQSLRKILEKTQTEFCVNIRLCNMLLKKIFLRQRTEDNSTCMTGT